MAHRVDLHTSLERGRNALKRKKLARIAKRHPELFEKEKNHEETGSIPSPKDEDHGASPREEANAEGGSGAVGVSGFDFPQEG